MDMPAQALGYKLGSLKFAELRKKAETTLGDKFDIKEFHNKILENGAIPLSALRIVIENWIEDKSK